MNSTQHKNPKLLNVVNITYVKKSYENIKVK